LVNCDSNGDFVAQNLWGGEYYVAAFHGVDFAALRDPEILHLVIDRGQKIVLAAADASATVRLSELPWF
jgi:hypothetical protein